MLRFRNPTTNSAPYITRHQNEPAHTIIGVAVSQYFPAPQEARIRHSVSYDVAVYTIASCKRASCFRAGSKEEAREAL
jgi:hypothetical protein